MGNVHHSCHTFVRDKLILIVHHNLDHSCDGLSYLKGMSVIQLDNFKINRNTLTILPLDMNKLEPGPFQNLHIIAQYGEIHLEYLNLNDLYMQMCQYI